MGTTTTTSTPGPSLQQKKAVNRFVSTFSAAFRAFYLYNQDNKAFDEIMQNLARRFQDSAGESAVIKLGITNRTFLYEGEPVGYREVTIFVCALFRNLGYKEIIFRSPIQSRNFFQLLYIVTSKDNEESKNERLVPFLADGDPKPISLVPITAKNIMTRMSDEMISIRLGPLLTPKNRGGIGFYEDLISTKFESIADFFNWVCMKVDKIPAPARIFARNLTDSVREGFFPIERYLKLFPFPDDLLRDFQTKLDSSESFPERKSTPLSHRFLKKSKSSSAHHSDLVSRLVTFSEEDVKNLQLYRSQGVGQLALQDLDLAESLLKTTGPDFILGLCFLLRYLNEKNPVAIQEKALKIGMDVWNSQQTLAEDLSLSSLFSSLRQSLVRPQNILLALFPLRNATIESNEFKKIDRYLKSLGQAAITGLIESLDVEQDRGMRKKICTFLTEICKNHGIDELVKALPKASVFLLRNLIMVLGDAKPTDLMSHIFPYIRHEQKIIRTETVRSLCKEGSNETEQAVLQILEQSADNDIKQIILDHVSAKKSRKTLPTLMRISKLPHQTSAIRKSIYQTAAAMGGTEVKLFLQSVLQDSNFLNKFNSEQKEELALVQTLLSRMKP